MNDFLVELFNGRDVLIKPDEIRRPSEEELTAIIEFNNNLKEGMEVYGALSLGSIGDLYSGTPEQNYTLGRIILFGSTLSQEQTKAFENYIGSRLDPQRYTIKDSNILVEIHNDSTIKQLYQKPKNYVQPLTKVNAVIFDGKTDLSSQTGIIVKNSRIEANQVKVYLQVEKPKELLQTSAELTPYDWQVFNGICSIMESGQNVFTSRQVYEAFAGKGTTSPQALGAVTKSIKKMRTTLISIDWTEHARMALKNPKLEAGARVTSDENLLYMRGVRIESNGQIIDDGYMLLKNPILYDYAKEVGQICTTDKNYLNVPMDNTEERIILRNYLIRQIEHMKKAPTWNRTLKFETIFANCNIDSNKKKLASRRKDIFNMLDYWSWKSLTEDQKKEQTEPQYIKDYTVNMQGRLYYSITIEP